MSGENGGTLKSFVERIENLRCEQDEKAEDIREVFKEAKGTGLDVKTLRKVIALRRRDESELKAEKAQLEIYLHELQMGWLT